MYILLIVVIIVVVAAVVVAGAKAKAAGGIELPAADHYYAKPSIFTPAERSFLDTLEQLCGADQRILTKVRLADLFGVKSGYRRSARQSALNRIISKHVDFLLVAKSDGKPIVGIELDDATNDEEHRQRRDAFVDAVFNQGGLPIVHIRVKGAYVEKEISEVIQTAISKSRPSVLAAPGARNAGFE